MLRERLCALLRCPNCHYLHLEATGSGFICQNCAGVYPIEDGIVHLLAERDRPLARRAFSPLAARSYDLFAARGGMRNLYGRDFTQEFEAYTRTFELQPDDVVVDVGCGSGNYTLEFARWVPKGLAIGVDLSEAMLRLLVGHARGLDNVIAIQANAENLPFKGGAIPKMFNGCLHHLAPRLTPCLAEARRCVRHTLHGSTIFAARSPVMRPLLRLALAGIGARPVEADQLAAALRSAGFDQFTVEPAGIKRFFFGTYQGTVQDHRADDHDTG